VVVELEVLGEGGLGIDGQPEDLPGHLAVVADGGDPAFVVRKGRRVEQPGDALPALDLAQQDSLPVVGECQCERGGHRRLAGATLARHYMEADALPVAFAARHAR
jgi:hypothetical protein